jgi:hypothetical protein
MAVGLAVLTACSGPTDAVVIVSLDVVSGNTALAAPNTVLPPLVLRVSASNGAGIPGQTVTFTVTGGGGSVSPASAASDGRGQVSVVWTMGPLLNIQTMEASVSGATATGAPIVLDRQVSTFLPRVTVVGTPNLTAPVGTHLPPVTLLVQDENNAPLAGFIFTLRSLTCTLQNGLDCTSNLGTDQLTGNTLTTGSDGTAIFGGWTLGPTSGPKCLGAYPGTAPPQSTSDVGSLAVCATALAGPIAQLKLVAMTQVTPTAFEVDIQALDGAGNAADGIPITFSASSGGSVSPTVDTTRHIPADGDGQAFTNWTPGPSPATLTVSGGGVTTMIGH